MAATQRNADTDLGLQTLSQLEQVDDFFHLVRALERLCLHAWSDTGQVPAGGDGPPQKEFMRFCSGLRASFAKQSVEQVVLKPAERKAKPHYELTVNMLGLTGASGVLPQHYTTLTLQRVKKQDHALADFFNLFNHRLISLYYRAWAKYRLVVAEEGSRLQPQSRSPYLLALQALAGQPHSRHGDPRIYYAGHFSRFVRSAASLETLLTDFLGHAVQVQTFVGKWLHLEQADRLRIGSHQRGANNRLGDGVLLGNRIWDVQSRMRIVIGWMTHSEYEAIMPGSPAFSQLKQIVDSFVAAHIDYRIEYKIRDAKLIRHLGHGLCLGRNFWLGQRSKRDWHAVTTITRQTRSMRTHSATGLTRTLHH